MNDELPPPLEDGRRPQTPVEYLGPKTGTFTIRGPVTNREYLFAQSPLDRWSWVFDEDLERFHPLADYRVHEEHSIDPIRDALRASDQRVEALERMLAERLRPEPAARVRGGGRPPIPDDLGMQAWHLHHHCSWSWGAVAGHQGLTGSKPEAAAQLRGSRWAVRNPVLTACTGCALCLNEDCPPAPE